MRETTKTIRKRKELPIAVAIPLILVYYILKWIENNQKKVQVLLIASISVCTVITVLTSLDWEARVLNNLNETVKTEEIDTIKTSKPIQLAVSEKNNALNVIESNLSKVSEESSTKTIQTVTADIVSNDAISESTKEEYVDMFEETENTYFTEVPSEEEFLYKAVGYAEAGMDGEEAVRAVMHVLNNRVNSNQDFGGKTIKEVVNAPTQFTPVIGGKVYILTNPPELITEVPDFVETAYDKVKQEISNGEDFTRELLRKEAYRQGLTDPKYWEEGALYFYNPKCVSQAELEARARIKVKILIGQQYFYCYWG